MERLSTLKADGHTPRELNTFETAICEALGIDNVSLYSAAEAWLINEAREMELAHEKLTELRTQMYSTISHGLKKRKLSGLGICDAIREFFHTELNAASAR